VVVVAIETNNQRGKAVERVTSELSAAQVIGPRSAFDLKAVTQVVAAVLVGIFLISFMAAFLPWLLAKAMTSAVEGLMHQVGFAQFRADNVVDWLLVFAVGLAAVAVFVVIAVVIAAIANGMGLLGMAAATQLIVTALVLLAAVTIDAVARRGRTAAGTR